jgi:hypothetical protein
MQQLATAEQFMVSTPKDNIQDFLAKLLEYKKE